MLNLEPHFGMYAFLAKKEKVILMNGCVKYIRSLSDMLYNVVLIYLVCVGSPIRYSTIAQSSNRFKRTMHLNVGVI